MCLSKKEFHELVRSLLGEENCRAKWTINDDSNREESVEIVARISVEIDGNATNVVVKSSTENSRTKIETAVLAINEKILNQINNLVEF